MLLFKGCMEEDALISMVSVEEDENINLERLIREINQWHELNVTSLQIERYQWTVDSKLYYGWRSTANDELGQKSFTTLSKKQLRFIKIVIKIALANGGLFSLNAAIAVEIPSTETTLYSLMTPIGCTPKYTDTVEPMWNNGDSKYSESNRITIIDQGVGGWKVYSVDI